MAKVGNALRRSSVVLRSLGSTHSQLQLLINQLKETRGVCKALVLAQSSTNQDLVKWADQEENRAIKETVGHIGEMLNLYTDIQKNFSDRLKDFTHHFEMILVGERTVDSAKNQLEIAVEKESKSKRELKRATKRSSSQAELDDLTGKLAKAIGDKDLAQYELNERLRDHEAVKMIRLKTGLIKWSESGKEMSTKSHIVFTATQDIAKLIPDVPDATDIQDIRYTGTAAALRISMETKEKLQAAQTSTTSDSDLPPPYSEVQPAQNPFLYNTIDGATGGIYPRSANSSFVSYSTSSNATLNNSASSCHNSTL